MNTDNISRDDWILGGLALLFIVALAAFPWFSVSIGPFTATLTGTDGPDSFLAILAVIAAIAVIADLGVERLAPQVVVPAIGGSREMTRFVLACVAAGLFALKFLFHIGNTFKYLGWGFPVDVIVAAALLYFALQARTAVPAPVVAPPSPPTPAGPAGSTGPPTA